MTASFMVARQLADGTWAVDPRPHTYDTARDRRTQLQGLGFDTVRVVNLDKASAVAIPAGLTDGQTRAYAAIVDLCAVDGHTTRRKVAAEIGSSADSTKALVLRLIAAGWVQRLDRDRITVAGRGAA